jgi:hypothetical protein
MGEIGKMCNAHSEDVSYKQNTGQHFYGNLGKPRLRVIFRRIFEKQR